MYRTRKYFTQDELIDTAKKEVKKELGKRFDSKKSRRILDSVLSALAVFTFKFPSLLQFDKVREAKGPKLDNLKRLFGIEKIPSDTSMREILDEQSLDLLNPAYEKLISRLQRGKVLRDYLVLNKYHAMGLDATGFFNSNKVFCENCCTKVHKDGGKEYYHQGLALTLLHKTQKVVFPCGFEPIVKQDGNNKNDCERNAAKRLMSYYRRAHPHLPTLIIADGLYSNAPFIKLLQQHNCRFMLVCKESDHKYLTDWVNAADHVDAPVIRKTFKGGTKREYQYMKDVPLNNNNADLRVNVVRCWEEDKKGKESGWMWVTDLEVNEKNIEEIVSAGRARWKIENETFNTLKNQGYEFEHNFGHGNKNLSNFFAKVMLLAFFIDQCSQKINMFFQQAYLICGRKSTLWEEIRACLKHFKITAFESLYQFLSKPPPKHLLVTL